MKRIILLSILLISLFGCTSVEEQKELQDITLKLKWVHQAQFTGNYVAKEKGFYEQQGLNVNLEPFSFEDPTIEAVVNGEADFGITGGDEVLLAREKGFPIKAFAVIYRINPVCAYSLKESGIVKPEDFLGKTVGLERGVNVDTLYYAMMHKLELDRTKVNEVDIGYDATELLEGKTDVSTGYIINEPNQAIEAGYEVNTILMADYGVNMYADVLFATEHTINNNPELVEKFLKATLDGWQYAIENEEEAVNIVLRYATDRTKSHESYMLKESIPLIYSVNNNLGIMKESEWQRAYDILREQKLLKQEQDFKQAYTSQFLEKVYS